MKQIFVTAVLVLLCGCNKVAPGVEPSKEEEKEKVDLVSYCLASYNIRYNSGDDTGDKDWSTCRKNLVAKLVRQRDFDVCGFVEVTQSVMSNDLNALLGDKYLFKFCGRNNGSTSGEAVGFGYKSSKFQLVKSGYFFLNTHPDQAGEATSWADPQQTYNRSRIAAWGLFKDKVEKIEFLFIVTHFELNKGMRAGSANLCVEKAQALVPEGTPVFLCGDLNAAPTETTCVGVLTQYFKDSYSAAYSQGLPREGQITTYNGYSSSVSKTTVSKRIDYMFYHGATVNLQKYGVIYDLVDGKLPSDHYPIYVKVGLPR